MYLGTDQLSANSFYTEQHKVSTLWEKGSNGHNEDVLLREGNLFGVFDGATSLTRETFTAGATGGLLAAQTAARAFADEQGNLLHRADKANRLIRSRMLQHDITLKDRHRLWSASAAVVRLNHGQMEYCRTGDSIILLLLKDGSCKLLTPDLDIDRETLQIWQASSQASSSTIHVLLAEQIQRVRLQMNRVYGVLNGQPEAMDFVEHGWASLEKVTDILLFTDGLFLPRKNPETEQDWHAFATLYRQGGLTAIRDHVRALQQQDPSCTIYPRFKQHDDIAAVAVAMSS